MNDKHRSVLRRQWVRLRRDLEPKKLLPYLVSVLDEADEQEVQSKETREERTDKLLEILRRSGPQAFACFLEALENVQPFLVGPLKEEAAREEKLAEMKTELSRARTHSAKLREEMTSIGIVLESEKNKHDKTRKELDELKSLHHSLLKQFKNENSNMTFAINELKAARKADAKELTEERRRRAELERELNDVKHERDEIADTLKEEIEKDVHNNCGNNNSTELNGTEKGISNKEKLIRKWSLDETLRSSRNCHVESSPRRRTVSEMDKIWEQKQMKGNDIDESERLRSLVESMTHERDSLNEKCKEMETKLRNLELELLQGQKQQKDRATSPIENGVQNGEIKELIICDKCTLLEDRCEEIRKEKDHLHFTNRSLKETMRQLECRIKEMTDKFEREKTSLEGKVKSMEEQCERAVRDHSNEIRNTKMEMTEQHLLVVKDLQNQKAELVSQVDRDKSDALRLKAELDRERESSKAQQRDSEKTKKRLQSEKKQLKQKLEQETKTKKEAQNEVAKYLKERGERETRVEGEFARLKQSLTVQLDECEALKADLEQWQSLTGRVFNYKKDFDRNGLIYALGTNFCTTAWLNPGMSSSEMGVVVTRSSDDQGCATDLLETKKGTLSCTRDEERSWWSVDLGDKYTLLPTQYTLRHGRDNGLSIVRNWRLEGSRDGKQWRVLKVHENDRGLKGVYPFYTGTWSIDGQVGAMRYFRIFQTGKNSSGRHALYLSGFEIYGVLVDMRV